MERYKRNLQNIPYKMLHEFAGYNKTNTRKQTSHVANAELRALYNAEIARRNSEKFLMKQKLAWEINMNPEITSLAGIKGKKMPLERKLELIKKYYDNERSKLFHEFVMLPPEQQEEELKKGDGGKYGIIFGIHLPPSRGGFTRKRRGRSLRASRR